MGAENKIISLWFYNPQFAIHIKYFEYQMVLGGIYFIVKTEDLTRLIPHMPILQGHGPLKYYEENFGSIQVPAKILVFTP